jgi:hypothetical protein
MVGVKVSKYCPILEPLTRLEELQLEFREYDERHPQVWVTWVKKVFEKIAEGKKHYGAKAIMELVRWETDMGDVDPELNVNNNYTSFYTRKFNEHYPEYDKFLRTRVQKSAEYPATGRKAPKRSDLDDE